MLSCKMITHGRVHLLEEALNSFLLQNDPEDTELVIVNDYPHQFLIFDHPRVKIYNMETIFPSIGQKENYALELCSGDTFVVWDDDDLAMPNHLNNIRKFFVPGSNLMHWNRAVFYNEPVISAITGVGNSGIVYSKDAWLKIGKTPIENAGYDLNLVSKIRDLDPSKVIHADPPDNEVSWWYRWATPQNYHQSGMGTDTPDRKNVVLRNYEYVESQRKFGKIPVGDIYLKPHYRFDYPKILKDYVS